jgi:hypothetical protein
MNRVLLACALVAVSILSTAQPEAPIRRPEVRVGDSWTYRSTNLLAQGTHAQETRVTFSNDQVIFVVSTLKSDGREFDSSYTSEWNTVTYVSRNLYRPHSGLFRFPLRIGEKREVKYELLLPQTTAIESTSTGTITVVGWETVDVPAGKFRAIRIEMDSIVQPANNSRAFSRQLTTWYVPDVRRWVKLQGVTPRASFSEELLEYKLNED